MSVKPLLAVVVCLVAGFSSAAQSRISVAESAITARAEAGRIIVSIPTENAGNPVRDARATIELLDEADRILDRADPAIKLKPGKNVVEAPLRIAKDAEVSDIIWHRVRYVISAGQERIEGVVSVSEIVPDLFSIRLVNIDRIRAGARVPVRVYAYHPITNAAMADVDLTATIEIDVEDAGEDDDEVVLKGESRTGADGVAEIVFLIPETVRFESENWGIDIDVTGTRNGLAESADDGPNAFKPASEIFFIIDKPLFQPGQTVHARALAMSRNQAGDAMTVLAGLELEFSIRDEEETVLNRQTVRTSEFGIAAIEWQIPANAKLGTYRVKVDADDIEFQNESRSFQISRYDLPNFAVNTKSDKDFYLPDDNTAEVTVDAMYLFGKPVTAGSVRVVREGSRRWNYREQKWEIEEEAVYKGDADTNGKYVAKIDLGQAQAVFRKDGDSKYRDLNFTAYFTDASSNRTEQKRFDLRLSKEPIHVYLNRERRSGDQNPKIPYRLYVTTLTADGKPAACDVEIKGKYEDESAERKIAQLKTSGEGAGKSEFLMPKRDDDTYFDDLEVKVIARDAANREGTEEFDLEIDEDELQIRVSTDRSIYRKGEPIRIEILSSEAESNVFIDVLKSSSALETRRIRTKNGRASLRIPYRPEFAGILTIAATADDGDLSEAYRTVVFPDPKRLGVSAVPDRETYRPDEEAELAFKTVSFDKRAVAAALGVVIVDQAVEERARTENGTAPDVFADLRGFGADTWQELRDAEITPRMQLFAEMRFAGTEVDYGSSGNYYGAPSSEFAERHNKQFAEIEKALKKRFEKDFDHPTDDEGLRRILGDAGIDLGRLRDPWGMPFRPDFSVSRGDDLVSVKSAGPNKKFGDADDFNAFGAGFPYFKKTGIAFDEAIKAYEARTGTFVRDPETLKAAAAEKGLDLDSLTDRWGRPYRVSFGVWYRSFSIEFSSSGERPEEEWDDFTIHTQHSDYFAGTEKRINDLLERSVAKTGDFPKNEPEFLALIKANGLDLESLRDVWGRPYYFSYEEYSVFADRVRVENIAQPGEQNRETLSITPVTRRIGSFRILSLGENGKRDDGYDLGMATFAGILSEQARDDGKPKLVVPKALLTNGKSAIYGVVKDANDGLVAGASVIITSTETESRTTTATNSEGAFLQTGLPAGKYSVRVESPGFKVTVVSQIVLGAEQISEINVRLEAGTVDAVVTVSGVAVTVDVSEAKLDTTISRTFIPGVPRTVSGGVLSLPSIQGARSQSFAEFGRPTGGITIVTRSGGPENRPSPMRTTPRLREYFPETLLFVPELVTGSDGRIAFRYRLADNITTWKIYAVASDKQGRIGFAETSIKAFQPFFADLDPPKFLTVGDAIRLPVQIRNYTPQTQRVDVTMDRADWFAFTGPGSDGSPQAAANRQTVNVSTGATENAVFGFRAERPVTDGKQRVTAAAATDSDAIEKSVTVRPDGEEIVRTESRIFAGTSTLALDYPANSLAGTKTAELKIYPNLMAHVTESIEGLIKRPYGCAEQTVSAAYPNLMFLKLTTAADGALAQRARRNLERGYEQLVGFRSPDGGFGYWGAGSKPDIALTAYALRFLHDAAETIAVDEDLVRDARDFIVKQQRSDGSWTVKYEWEKSEDLQRTRKISAYVTRVLAMTKPVPAKDEDKETPAAAALGKALRYLNARNAEIDEPWSIASYGLAALDAGDPGNARAAAVKLAAMAHPEGQGVYWNLETNTPFYGWGAPGRIETTALAAQLLVGVRRLDPDPAFQELSAKATIFLLRSKDRYGVWYSTQATVNVLDALLASLTKPVPQSVEVSVGGKAIKKIDIPADRVDPVTIDLSGSVSDGDVVTISGSRDGQLMTQVVRTHYIDWKDTEPDRSGNGLRLSYDCDRTDGAVMDNVNCTVEAERIGYKGYGMLLAEIGLPPGADVARESLEQALSGDRSISRYEVLPDRIIVYLWAAAGGTKFSFAFKPRYSIDAQTPASFAYDYYNPESRATVSPLRFRFREN